MVERFASPSDYEKCRLIHKKFGTTYYYATMRFPREIRNRVHALYAFVRIPDEWVDNPTTPAGEQLRMLEDWKDQLCHGLQGKCPEHFAMRAFVDVVRECKIPFEEADLFIQAMAMDVTKSRYETYEDLRSYMRGSASAVGVMMCYAMGASPSPSTISRAHALGEAMQLTNFLRDVGEDWERGRVYLPLEVMREHGVTEADLARKVVTPQFVELMRHEICRARKLYYYSDLGIGHLPPQMQKAVMMARLLYAQILDQIEAQHYDVFTRRARTTKAQKLACALRVMVKSKMILAGMVAGPVK